MIQRGEAITVLHTYPAPVRGVVTTVNPFSRMGRPLKYATFDWHPMAVLPAHYTIFLLSEFSEGWVWARGHGDEQERALLTARSLL
jgi:hypothetical protein